MSLTQLLVHYKVRFDSNETLEICLDDFIENIAECKPSYATKIKDKTKRNGLWYKDAEVAISELCPKLRSKKAKKFYEQWKSFNTTATDTIVSDSTNEMVNTETLTSFLDIRNNYFQYKGKQVLVIVKEGVVWFKGVDIARLLEFQDMHQTLRINVQDPDKTTFITLGVCINTYPESQKIDPQTIFINQEGMYDLVMSSRKPEAKIFRRWISHEVLPSINRFGSYSIEKKYGCFYDDHDLYEYDGCNVCYMAYIGVHDGIPLFKYGITFDYYRREYQEHRKTFDTFQLLYLRQTDNNHIIEGLFTKECKSKDIYVQKEFKGKNRTELFTVNESQSFERMRMIMDKLIEQNPTKEHQKYEKEIQRLRQEKDELNKDYKHTIELLTEKTERIQALQNDKEFLQKEKTVLYQLFSTMKDMIASFRP